MTPQESLNVITLDFSDHELSRIYALQGSNEPGAATKFVMEALTQFVPPAAYLPPGRCESGWVAQLTREDKKDGRLYITLQFEPEIILSLIAACDDLRSATIKNLIYDSVVACVNFMQVNDPDLIRADVAKAGTQKYRPRRVMLN